MLGVPLDNTGDVRALLATCWESRWITRAILPNEIPFIGGGGLRYDARRDVICLAELTIKNQATVRELVREWRIFGDLPPPVSASSEEGRWMGEACNIGIEIGHQDVGELDSWFDNHGVSTLDLVKLMEGFGALKKFFVISRPMGEFDPLEDKPSLEYCEYSDQEGGGDSISRGLEPMEESGSPSGHFVGRSENEECYGWGDESYRWIQQIVAAGEMGSAIDHLVNLGWWRCEIARHFERPDDERPWRLDEVCVEWLVHFADEV